MDVNNPGKIERSIINNNNNEVKRKESERHVLMLEFVRQSHLFQTISSILQDTRIKLAFNFREFQLAIVFGS